MKRIFIIVILLTLLAPFSHAQCEVDEVEIRVNIVTDPWGEETFWTLSDLMGNVILQGGQGGVYEDNTSYADSICVQSNTCLFFEIYDSFGDGILEPNGCEVYVGETLVYSISNDINSYAMTVLNCWNSCGMMLNALNDLQAHINDEVTLDASELTFIRTIFTLFPECLASSESLIVLSKSVVEDYDNEIGAIFTTPTTENGFSKDPEQAPGMELERAIIALQQGIFDHVFTSEVYANYPQHINGWMFETCYSYPGYVDPPLDSSAAHSMLILADFQDPDGANPYYDINGDGTEHALRPTGLYLAPGSVATVSLPESLVGQNFFVRVGSHEWDLTDRVDFKRLDRISRKFAINSTTLEVFNPLGGAISILVPYGANAGVVEVSVTNCVEAPFFSLKSFYETPDFEAELDKPGPWAVFETENVMFTIPKHSIVPGQYDLMQAMLDWETAVRGVNSILAREIVPDKHNMYMISDIDIRFGAYSIGYPMSNTPQRFTDVPGPAYFLNGPGPDDEVNFHESGHALAISKFPGEEEALVNVPYIMALNYGLGEDLITAVNYSFVPNTFDIDKTATHRMVSNTFGSARNISNTTNDEVRYQHRGYGHYFEIVNVLGWCPLRNFWKQEYIDFENGIDHSINDQDVDGRILRMSVAAQADLRPLFHVFGILPQDPVSLQTAFDQAGIVPSLAIYNRLQAYIDLIPEDNSAFVNYALSVYPNLYADGLNESPDYGVGWHYQKSLTYNAAEGQERTDILHSIIDLYYPNGAPTGNEILDVCCMLDTLVINLDNEDVVITGGVEPYAVSIETDGAVQTVTVVDFDGCEATLQTTAIDEQHEGSERLTVYPNPASTEIKIDWTGGNSEIESLRMVSVHGQIIYQSQKADRINTASFSEGMYLLLINLVSGEQLIKRVLIAR